jgi:hypothetical protein
MRVDEIAHRLAGNARHAASSDCAEAGEPSESVTSTSASLMKTHDVELIPGVPGASAR